MSAYTRKTTFKRPLCHDEAIIMSFVRYGEADCIVRLFCKEKGRLSAFAKNGLKPSKQRGSVVQAPARAQVGLIMRPQANLSQLVLLDIASHVFSLSDNLRFWGWACYAVEIVELFIPEHEPAPHVFEWLDILLHSFSKGQGSASTLRAFELKLLAHCGYLPDLSDVVESIELPQWNESANKAALGLLMSPMDAVPDYDEPTLRIVAGIFLNQLRSHRKGPLRSVEFLKSMGV